MIDLTPLDVRNKRGDFSKALRGYDGQEVDLFLELVAERMEQLVMENLRYRERADALTQQVQSQSGRERAVQEALVTAQELRSDIRSQAQREADLVLAEARTEARRLIAEAEAEVRTMVRDAERKLEQGRDALEEMERRRTRFIKSFRQLLEREMDVVEVEEARMPLEDRPIDLDLGGGRTASPPVQRTPQPPAHPAAQTGALLADDGDDLETMAIEDLHPDAPPVSGSGPITGRAAPVTDPALAPPPLDAPVDELAAAFEAGAIDGAVDGSVPAAGGEGGVGGEDETLYLSLEDGPPDDEGTRWG